MSLICCFSLETCRRCCREAAEKFEAIDFTLEACEGFGCDRPLNPDERCDNGFGSEIDDPGRKGCELGRDFRLAGVSALLDPNFPVSVNLFQCRGENFLFNGNESQEVNNEGDELFSVIIQLPSVDVLIRNQEQCEDCCDDANRNFDNGNEDVPDDFRSATCENNCATLNFCFEEPEHRERLACLVALDFRNEARTTLNDNIVTCEAIGLSLQEPLTNFPTATPTDAPTNAPTIAEEELNQNIIIGSIAGSLSCVLFVCLITAYTLGRRSKMRSASRKLKPGTSSSRVDNPFGQTMETITLSQIHGFDIAAEPKGLHHANESYDQSSLAQTITTTQSASDQNNVVIKIHVPIDQVQRDSFDLRKYIPAKLSFTGNSEPNPSEVGSRTGKPQARRKLTQRASPSLLSQMEGPPSPDLDPFPNAPPRSAVETHTMEGVTPSTTRDRREIPPVAPIDQPEGKWWSNGFRGFSSQLNSKKQESQPQQSGTEATRTKKGRTKDAETKPKQRKRITDRLGFLNIKAGGVTTNPRYVLHSLGQSVAPGENADIDDLLKGL